MMTLIVIGPAAIVEICGFLGILCCTSLAPLIKLSLKIWVQRITGHFDVNIAEFSFQYHPPSEFLM